MSSGRVGAGTTPGTGVSGDGDGRRPGAAFALAGWFARAARNGWRACTSTACAGAQRDSRAWGGVGQEGRPVPHRESAEFEGGASRLRIASVCRRHDCTGREGRRLPLATAPDPSSAQHCGPRRSTASLAQDRPHRTAGRARAALRRCAAALVLALAGLAVPLSAAQAQTVLWSDTLTVGSFTIAGLTYYGWDDSGQYTGASLSDQEFDYGEHAYNLESIGIIGTGGNLILKFDGTGAGDIATAATRDKLTFHVDNTPLKLADGTLGSDNRSLSWASSGLTWSSGDTVALQITTTDPGAPQNVTATPGPVKVTLGWAPPDSIGGSAITGYEYRFRTGSDYADDAWTAIPDSASLTSYDVTGLTPGTPYTFQLRARNSSGAEVYSEEVEATPARDPLVGDGRPGRDQRVRRRGLLDADGEHRGRHVPG